MSFITHCVCRLASNCVLENFPERKFCVENFPENGLESFRKGWKIFRKVFRKIFQKLLCKIGKFKFSENFPENGVENFPKVII